MVLNDFFKISSLFEEDFQFDEYFSDGLKPPTSKHILPKKGKKMSFLFFIIGGMWTRFPGGCFQPLLRKTHFPGTHWTWRPFPRRLLPGNMHIIGVDNPQFHQADWGEGAPRSLWGWLHKGWSEKEGIPETDDLKSCYSIVDLN